MEQSGRPAARRSASPIHGCIAPSQHWEARAIVGEGRAAFVSDAHVLRILGRYGAAGAGYGALTARLPWSHETLRRSIERLVTAGRIRRLVQYGDPVYACTEFLR